MALDQTTTNKLSDWYSTYTGQNAGGTSNAFNPGSGVFGTQSAPSPGTNPTMLNLGSLDRRTVDRPTETVAGQLGGLLNSGSSYIQGARERTARAANARGLLNSTLAASAGEDAAIQAALPIATNDAQTYGKAADYNTTLFNQARMYNADVGNAVATQQRTIDADRGARQMQIEADRANQERAIAADRINQEAQRAAQLEQARIQADTSRYGTDVQAGTSRYTADQQAATARANADNALNDTRLKNNTTMANNIIQSQELSPDRKAALLRAIGPEYEPYAAAIYIGSELAPQSSTSGVAVGGAPASGAAAPAAAPAAAGPPLSPLDPRAEWA